MISLDNHSKRIIAQYIPKTSFLNYHIASNKKTDIIGWFNQASIYPPFENQQLFPFKKINNQNIHKRRILGTLILKPNVYIKELSPYLKTTMFRNRQLIIVNEDYDLNNFDLNLIDFAIHHWNRDILPSVNCNFNKIPKIIFDFEHKNLDRWSISYMFAEFIILPSNIPKINCCGAYNDNLKTLIFPHESITCEIKNSFNYLSSLTEVILPPNIKLISNSFNACRLNKLKIPKNCRIISNSFNQTTLNDENRGIIIIDSFESKITQY